MLCVFLLCDKLEFALLMKKMFAIILLCVLSLVGYFVIHPIFAKSSATEELTEIKEPEIILTTKEYTIKDGDTFTVAAEALNIPYSEALIIVDNAKPIFDFTKVKLGKKLVLVSLDGVSSRLEYEPNSETIISVDLQNNYATTEEPIKYDISFETAEVTITNSLYLDGINSGLPEMLILKFADVFAWEVDFATQVQPNDTMHVLYEKRSRNNVDSGVGDILWGEFKNMGEGSFAYRFINSEGDVTYYNENGESLVREFLKAPLSFSRITSGYTNSRFHPTLEKNMPHLAIDYAAAIGTPILAVADGNVTRASWNGGYGNYIDIRHNSIYETQYAHLSAYNVKAGDHVKQGDVIGYVGSTGFSTGPHLHYQVKVNGALQNPLEVEFPKGDAIEENQMYEFIRQKEEIDSKR